MAITTNPPRPPAPADPPTPPAAQTAEENRPPWAACFQITDVANGAIVPNAPIAVAQVGPKTFRLCCAVEFTGERTGLEGKTWALRNPNDDLDAVLARMRTVTPDDLVDQETDLASVPRPLQWLVPRYGTHTPAAIVHDRMIGNQPDGPHSPLHDWAADRFFRYMLAASGISPLRRYTMWTATVLRTRLNNGVLQKLGLAAWGLACFGGILLFVGGLVSGSAPAVVVSVVLPFAAALLFGRQYGAGICWAIAAPVVVPPTLVVVLALGVWRIEDRISRFLRRRQR